MTARSALAGPGSVAAFSSLEYEEDQKGRLLRLCPGDEGYVSWAVAKRAFRSEICRLLAEEYAGNDVELTAVLAAFPDFPTLE
jgi:hypothetical protein